MSISASVKLEVISKVYFCLFYKRKYNDGKMALKVLQSGYNHRKEKSPIRFLPFRINSYSVINKSLSDQGLLKITFFQGDSSHLRISVFENTPVFLPYLGY